MTSQLRVPAAKSRPLCNTTNLLNKIYYIPREGGSELIPYLLSGDLKTAAGSTLVIKKDLIKEVGYFDEDFERRQDIEFLVRVLKQSSLVYVDKVLMERHNSPTPSAEDFKSADMKLLQKFSDDVIQSEINGYSIISRRHASLAKLYCRDGHIRKSIVHITRAKKTPINLLGIFLAVIRGL